MHFEPRHVPGRVAGVGAINRMTGNGCVALGIVVEMCVERQLLPDECLVSTQLLNAVVNPEETTFDVAHERECTTGSTVGSPRP